MINLMDKLFRSRLFVWTRISQFVVALCIFTLAALMPSDFVKTQQPDKIMHFVGNALLFLSAYLAWGVRLKLWLLTLMLIPYSIMIEASQWFTASRHMDVNDAAANISGLVAGAVIGLSLHWIWRKIKPKSNYTGC